MISLRSFDKDGGVDTSVKQFLEVSCAIGDNDEDKEEVKPVLIDSDDAVFCELFNEALELLSVEDIGRAFLTTLLIRFITVTAEIAACI